MPETAGLIVGRSPHIQELRRQIARYSRFSKDPVLITGKRGTGKTLVATALHEASGRTGPFVHVNCAAIPKGLAESELFGHVKSAFTGAVSDRKGACPAANGGTLFLDEIGSMPKRLQHKLLTVLENMSIVPVGADPGQPTRIRTRVIAATSNLAKVIKPLRDRLGGNLIATVPLAERPEDITPLAQHFLDGFLGKYEKRSTDLALHPDTIRELNVRSFPGNVRQLESAIGEAAKNALEQGTRQILPEHLPELQPQPTQKIEKSNPNLFALLAANPPLLGKLHAERDLLRLIAIHQSHYDIREASRMLGLSRFTVYKEWRHWQSRLGREVQNAGGVKPFSEQMGLPEDMLEKILTFQGSKKAPS